MTTLTLQVENPSILNQIKTLLKSFEGVKILGDFKTSENNSVAEVPNMTTRMAMNEAVGKHDAGIVCMSDINSFVDSIGQ